METVIMETMTISPKFHVVIPKALRETLKLKPGQKVHAIAYENRIVLYPERPMSEARGLLKGIDSRVERDPDRV